MLDAIVIAGSGEADSALVARSLASLVEGVVPGVLARVCVLAAVETGALATLCDQSGADLVTPQGSRTALDRLASPHVLLLPVGLMMPSGWARLLEAEFAAHGPLRPGESLMFASPWQRLRARMTNGFRRPNPFVTGGIVPSALARACDFGTTTPSGPMPIRASKLIRLQGA